MNASNVWFGENTKDKSAILVRQLKVLLRCVEAIPSWYRKIRNRMGDLHVIL